MKTKFNWIKREDDWYTATCNDIHFGVCLENDKKWHSYINDDDNPSTSSSFKTKELAMRYVENRLSDY